MTDKIAVDRDFLEHAIVTLEYAYSADDEMVQESIKYLRAALAAQPAYPVAWINRRVIYDPATDSVTGYGEPELSFERASYGYDYANAKPLVLAQPAPAAVPLTRPHCRECAKWAKAQADNKEWMGGVVRGREIVAQLAAAGDKP